MDLTRREFLGYTAGTASLMGLGIPKPSAGGPLTQRGRPWYTVYSDPNTYDSESMRGYWSALPDEWRICPEPPTTLSLVIVPYCMSLSPDMVDQLKCDLHEKGATVLMETGAGFASPGAFREHQHWLRERLDVHIAGRVDLWADQWANSTSARTPYIEFTWPRRTRIRDFSRVVVPADQPGEIIARAGDVPVAFRRKVGEGTLIYLGSPVGPALWAGDVQARRWLHAVIHAA